MILLKLFLKCTTWLIYGLFAVIVLYFPFAELNSYFARETRLYAVPRIMPIEDALLPLMCLAVIYGALARLRRTIEKPETGEKPVAASGDD